MTHVSYVKVWGGGQNSSARTSRGGADFQRADVKEGGKISVHRNLRIPPPPLVAVNNERSLTREVIKSRSTAYALSSVHAPCPMYASRDGISHCQKVDISIK